MTKHERLACQTICKAIKDYKMLWFEYESGSGKYWRKVEPYILAIKNNGKGNVYFTGYAYPSAERKTEPTNDNQGQYLLNKIDFNQFRVLDETFHGIRLEPAKIYGDLPTIKIICRVT